MKFLGSLLPICDTSEKPLFQFVLRLPFDALKNELIKKVTSPQHLQRLLSLHEEHERLKHEMESAVASQNWELASKCRAGRYELADKIRELAPDPIEIMPSQPPALGWCTRLASGH